MTPYSELPDAELNEAVAKKLGWTLEKYEVVHGYMNTGWRLNGVTVWAYKTPPLFATSLDACEPVFEWLKERGYSIKIFIAHGITVVRLTNPMEQETYARDENKKSRALCLAFMEVEE